MYSIFEQLLLKFNVTVYQVSKATGIQQSTLSTWKKNNSLISSEKAQILADYFGVSIDYLMGNSEDSSIKTKDNGEEELLLLCRKVGDISTEDRDELIDLFKNNIDIYMKAKGIK